MRRPHLDRMGQRRELLEVDHRSPSDNRLVWSEGQQSMHWKIKAFIQNAIARLPAAVSHPAYYAVQRSFGSLRRVDPLPTLRIAARIARAIRQADASIERATLLEIGTGRRLVLPITMWLLGANRIVTCDLHAYLRYDLVREDLQILKSEADLVRRILADLDLDRDRFDSLLHFSGTNGRLPDLLKLCKIEYLAPADAADLPLSDHSVNLHLSTSVLEHIAEPQLIRILGEGARIITEDGLFVHCIDHSDHFSHSDPALSAVNFLRYSDARWSRLAGNRFMYMNRLQVDDYSRIFRLCQHEIVALRTTVDGVLRKQIEERRLPIQPKYSHKPPETLATLVSIFVSRLQVTGHQAAARPAGAQPAARQGCET